MPQSVSGIKPGFHGILWKTLVYNGILWVIPPNVNRKNEKNLNFF